MLQVGPDANLINKMSCVQPDPDEEPSDEAKGDSRASPMYSRAKTTRDYPIADTKQKQKKQVTFHTTAFVVLIPTVKEYHDAGLGDLLWWNECDFQQFKLSAAHDVKEFMKTVPHMEAKKALKLYFQNFMDGIAPAYSPAPTPPRPARSEQEVYLQPMVDLHEVEAEEERTDKTNDDGEEENELPPIVSQRHDSITSTKYSRQHPAFSQTHQYQYHYHSEDEETTQSTSSYKDDTDGYGMSLDSISMFGKMLAVGIFVLMNRSHGSH